MSDWLPTLLHFAGYDLNLLPKNVQGIDQYDTLVGRVKSMRKEIVYEEYDAYRYRKHIEVIRQSRIQI